MKRSEQEGVKEEINEKLIEESEVNSDYAIN